MLIFRKLRRRGTMRLQSGIFRSYLTLKPTAAISVHVFLNSGKLEMRRSNSQLPLANWRSSRNGWAKALIEAAAIAGLSVVVRYSTIISRWRIVNSLNINLRTNTAEVPFGNIQRHLREFLQLTVLYRIRCSG